MGASSLVCTRAEYSYSTYGVPKYFVPPSLLRGPVLVCTRRDDKTTRWSLVTRRSSPDPPRSHQRGRARPWLSSLSAAVVRDVAITTSIEGSGCVWLSALLTALHHLVLHHVIPRRRCARPRRRTYIESKAPFVPIDRSDLHSPSSSVRLSFAALPSG